MTDLTLDDLGLAETSISRVASDHAQLIAATLDEAPAPEHTLPLLWHWAYFNPVVSSAELGPDGHPLRHGPLLTEFPRRMWVGGEVRAAGAVRLDEPATRRTHLATHTIKQGLTGDLLLVTLDHTIEQLGTVVLTERQDVIYRPAGGATRPPGDPVDLSALDADWRETITPDAPLLFRFSAITFNSHRIHYDHDYATGDEGYPALVVHGPLTAMLLARSATRHLHRELSQFSFRASAPLFVEQPITLTGSHHDDEVILTATRRDGVTAMTAVAR